MKIGFVGLSHLGLNYLAASAEKKFTTIGVDPRKEIIENLKKFKIIYKEPGLKKKLIKNRKRIYFSNDFKNLKKLDLIFVSLDLKTNKKGKSDTKLLEKLIKKTLLHISSKTILIILSQVKPGFTRSINFDNRRLFYQVETLIFGQSLKRALKPERIIVGSSSKVLPKKYSKFLKSFNCPIIEMSYESAEFAKISINILLASSITASNLLARLSKKISADWSEIKPALKLDKRIGKNAYINEGLGISGGNLERDMFTIKTMIKNDKPGNDLIKAYIKNSEFMKNWVTKILMREKKKDYLVGIFGLAYKDNTNSIKNSPAIELIKNSNLKKFKTYDPYVETSQSSLKLNKSSKICEVIKNSKILIFMTNWKNINFVLKYLKKNNIKKKIVIDPFGILKKHIEKNCEKYFTIGK